MGRVSLTEDYDDRSVIAKLNEMDKRVTENTTVVTAAEASAKASAQAAQETADRFAGSVGAVVQNANAQINASKAQVDQAKAEVDEAVTTVAGYDTRLTAVEDADTHNVKLEGNQTITGVKTFTKLLTSSSSEWRTNWIVPFYTKSMVLQPSDNAVFLVNDVVQDSQANLVSVDQIIHNNANTVYRDWQLQTAHGNADVTLEINANGEKYATAPTPSSNAPSTAIVNKAYVESTDGATNNLLHRTGNENITSGNKSFENQYGVTMITLKGNKADVNAGSYQASIPRLEAVDKNGVSLWQLETTIQADGRVALNCRIRNSDGSIKSVTLAQGDVIQ